MNSSMPIFLIPLGVGVIIQLTKVVIDFSKEGHFSRQNFFRAGGFPSVHSGISSSLITIMFLKYGIDSNEFAITLVFSFLFWYDAMNIRYEAGKHAKFINQINFDLKNALDLGTGPNAFYLKERLGHTFGEVIGGIIIGSIITIVLARFLLP